MMNDPTVSNFAVGAVMGGISLVGQLLIGYLWKRGVESKDEKIATLETRVNDLESDKIVTIERELGHAKEQRGRLYTRLESCERREERVEAELAHVKDLIPQMRRISDDLAQTSATLRVVTEEVRSIAARQFADAEKLGHVKGQLEAES